MKMIFSTLAIGLMLAGCGSSEEPTPPVSSDPVIGSPTGPRQDNPCPKGPNGDAPCVDTVPVSPETSVEAPQGSKPDLDVGNTVKPSKV